MERIIFNFEHLLRRAEQRSEGNLTEKEKQFHHLKKILEENVPLDWRFTTSPTAYFLISFQPDEHTDYRILGRSFRDLAKKDGKDTLGKEIIKILKKETLQRREMEELVEKYFQLLNSPDSTIFHELKTVLGKRAAITQEKELQRNIFGTIKQLVPLSENRLANRPNALILGEEIWVRQKEYLNPQRSPIKEFLVFNKLTKRGVQKGEVKIFTFDVQGNLKEMTGDFGNWAYNGGQTVEYQKIVPSDFRSQSFWTLPTRIDVIYWDLLYLKNHWLEETTPKPENEIGLDCNSAFLLCRLENLFDLAKNWKNKTYLQRLKK